MYCVPANEQETTISYGRNDEWASVYTSDRTVMTKLDKLANDPNNQNYNLESEHTVDGETVAKTYTMKKRLLSFRSASITRELTDEQREALGERFRAIREKKRQKETE